MFSIKRVTIESKNIFLWFIQSRRTMHIEAALIAMTWFKLDALD
jgi:hypothetical protein